jgi:hypothetical protein
MFEPVNWTCPDVYVASEAAIDEIPVCCADVFAPEITSLFVADCEIVMLLPAYNVTVPDDASAIVPAVPPPAVVDTDQSTLFCVCTDCAATDKSTR